MIKNITFKLLLLLLLGLLQYSSVHAKHIIGGELTYKFLGVVSGDTTLHRYRFTLNMYRDCFGGGADFDEVAVIGFFHKKGSNYTRFFDFTQPLGKRELVLPPDNACLIVPPNICVEKGEYVFERDVRMEGESVTVSYQRCCRNETISNLIAPGDQGITISVEITKEAFDARSSSPTFKFFPPTVICSGEPLSFDDSAVDEDGDQLVYEFCAPFLGGGKFGTAMNPGNANACDGVIPNPVCPPPYLFVNFATPTFNALVPMGGSPVVSIDPNTGRISGTPNILGQFVVGVCIKEYRNGVLLTIIRRDFQFNVTTCEKAVFAKIQADKEVGKTFTINLCGDSTVNFVNLSSKDQFVKEFDWRLFIGKDTARYTTKNVTHTFPGLGTYKGMLILNPNSSSQCKDTAFILVNVFPGIKSDFSYTYDTCIAGPTTFKDLSKSNAGPVLKWDWNFGDGKTDSIRNPIHLFAKPGVLDVSLTVTDQNECKDTKVNQVTWYPVPPILLVEPNSFVGCLPVQITFKNLSFPIDSTYLVEWDFGDGGTSGAISPTHIYTKEGLYNVKLKVTSPIGCSTSRNFSNFIEIKPSPVAGFSYTPVEVTNFNKKVTFVDESIDGNSWFWRFGQNINFTTNIRNPIYTYPDTGQYTVQQIVTHKSGCKDTAYALIDVIPKVTYYLPNALTPNGDGKNDEFKGTGFLVGAKNFEMTIWNRWGEQVFYTTDPEEGWNGQKNNTGGMSPDGVYVCTVTFVGPRGEPFGFQTYVTLLK